MEGYLQSLKFLKISRYLKISPREETARMLEKHIYYDYKNA